jgi:hypothetical protein
MEVLEKDKAVRKVDFEAKSFLRAWIQFMRCVLCTQSGGIIVQESITDTTGTARTYPTTASNAFHSLVMTSQSSSSIEGIVVGSSSAPNTVTTNALGSMVTTFNTSAISQSAITVDGNILRFSMTKKFLNNTASNITIREVGIYSRVYDSGNTWRTFCIVRDVLPEPVTILPDQVLVVTYTFQITVG